MVALLRRLAPKEGYNVSPLPDIRFLRSDRPLARTPVLYDPGIVIVCQGRKRGTWGRRVYLYDSQHYLAVSVPVPFIMETDASAEEPLLAIYMHLDFNMAADLLVQINRRETVLPADPQSMLSTPMDRRFSESVLRFLEAMARPLEAEILGPALIREIYYHVLSGEQGAVLHAALSMQGRFGRIAKAIRRIHGEYQRHLDVAALAAEAGMSVPTFHSHFKTITQTSPMQYLKSVRLHQARLLMVRNDLTAASAGLAVGYESASQFSREFRRLFGLSPKSETRRLKADFALPAPPIDSDFISSH
ncbi:AraC family transcriptional regulator [Martelella alba]|uniref:AraC family transcriptional regulator n=2 Tax=Martelella alba TaxID=2590451 RepID=A0ABY2SLI4_9HYPH|nr:AraC family transcriptional regulator [Martelella alba]